MKYVAYVVYTDGLMLWNEMKGYMDLLSRFTDHASRGRKLEIVVSRSMRSVLISVLFRK